MTGLRYQSKDFKKIESLEGGKAEVDCIKNKNLFSLLQIKFKESGQSGLLHILFIGRPWLESQKNTIKASFKDHIENDVMPKTRECKDFVKNNKEEFKDRSWETVKSCIRTLLLQATVKSRKQKKQVNEYVTCRL